MNETPASGGPNEPQEPTSPEFPSRNHPQAPGSWPLGPAGQKPSDERSGASTPDRADQTMPQWGSWPPPDPTTAHDYPYFEASHQGPTQPDAGGGHQPPNWQTPGGYGPGGYGPSWYPPGGHGQGPGGAWPAGPAWTPAPTPRRHRRGTRPLAAVALVVGVVAASVGVGHVLWTGSSSTSTPTASRAGTSTPSAGSPGSSNPFAYGGSGSGGSYYGGSGSPGSGTSGPSNVSAIAAKVNPALVDINVTFSYQQAAGAATGIVLTSNGEVLTNNHVVEGATSISVTDLGNNKTYSAKVVGYDNSADVAVIQLEGASGLKTAKIANSSDVKVGDKVVAVGNAGGKGGTPSAAGGAITGLNQAITASDQLTGGSEDLTGLLETSADVQSGDSGGSLVNTSGEVVGMDTAGSATYSLSSQTSQGYAIPINKALAIASQIESGKSSSTVHVGATAFLGVLVSSGSSGNSTPGYGYGSYGDQPGTSGVDVVQVVNGSAAAQAGLTGGDVITSVAGQSVSSPSALTKLLNQYKPGDSVQLGWTDSSGQTHTATVTLGSGPAQ